MPRPRYLHPQGGVKIIRAGVKIPREILTPGGQAAQGQDKPVHRLKFLLENLYGNIFYQ